MNTTTYCKQIEALSRIRKMMTSNMCLDDILNFIVSVTAEIMDSRICSLLLLDAKKELVIRATQAVSEEYRNKHPLRLGEGIAGRVAKENRPIAVLDVKKDRHYINHDIAEKEGLCSLLSVPLSVKGKVIGALNCYSDSPHEFTGEETNLLITIANQAVVVIENAQLMLQAHAIHEELEIRKVIDRAKGILMRQGLTEEEAFRRIQKKSMDIRKSMKEVAEAIILATELEKV